MFLFLKRSYLVFTLLIFSLAGQVMAEHSQSNEVFKINDKRALEVLDTSRELELLAEGFSWSEGPVWVSELDCLLFSDIPNNKVHKFCDESGLETFLADSGKSNGLAINANGDLVLMRGATRSVDVLPAPLSKPKLEFKTLQSDFDGKRLNSPNDLVLSGSGGMYFTDPPYELKGGINSPDKELGFQGVFYVDAKNTLFAFDKEISWPNGVALSNDEKHLFLAVSDPELPVWYKYTLGEDGLSSNKTLLFDSRTDVEEGFTQGLPDGMKMHSTGILFATGPGGVWLFSEAGDLLARIFVKGRPVANLTFDEKEDYLYLTADDQLLKLKLK